MIRDPFFFHWFVRLELDNLMTREKSFCFLFNYYKSFSPKKILDRLLRTRDEYLAHLTMYFIKYAV